MFKVAHPNKPLDTQEQSSEQQLLSVFSTTVITTSGNNYISLDASYYEIPNSHINFMNGDHFHHQY